MRGLSFDRVSGTESSDRPAGRNSNVRAVRLFILCLGAVTMFAVSNSLAQRPIRTFDPFYHGEAARRAFYDTYAVTAELSYRPSGLVQPNDVTSSSVPFTSTDPFGLNLRFDYHLASHLDLGFFIDAVSTTAGRTLSISWVTMKYYRTQEMVDYAIRLAVDPSSNGRSGFPQTDLAFLYTSLVTPSLSSDFAIGIRRVQIGIQQIVSIDVPPADPGAPVISRPPPDRDILRSRALGWEVHMMTGYNFLFDPAGSNLFVSFIGEGGRYNLVEWLVNANAVEPSERTTSEYRGGVIWVRSGLQFERPGFRFSPFLSLPLKQWAPSDGDWPRARPHVGLRLMLR